MRTLGGLQEHTVTYNGQVEHGHRGELVAATPMCFSKSCFRGARTAMLALQAVPALQ